MKSRLEAASRSARRETANVQRKAEGHANAESGRECGRKCECEGTQRGAKGRRRCWANVNGRATDVADPKLRMRDGSTVPFATREEAYKHLGNWRRADGSDATGWAKLKGRFRAALRSRGCASFTSRRKASL